MAMRPRKWLDRIIRERAFLRWSELAEMKTKLGQARRRQLREDATNLRRKLDTFLMRTDSGTDPSGPALDVLHLPLGTDWRWRPGFVATALRPAGIAAPASGARLGDETAVWHDCAQNALILKQVPNLRPTDLAAFSLRMEVFGFSGNFLSVSIDLPTEALEGLQREHILRLETGLSSERPMNVYARLNIVSGPNNDQVTHHIGRVDAENTEHQITEFDLAYTEINENRLEKIWIDLIFEAPYMNALDVRELFVSRHLRAEF